jgi:hypothetical protein
MAYKEELVPKAYKDHKGHKEQVALMVNMAQLVILVLAVHKDQLEQTAYKAQRV